MEIQKVRKHPVPTEMWFKIISYIDRVDDIKNLSLVCKLFNQIIGKSPEAMNKPILKLHANMTQHSQNIILESRRNYSRIRLFSFQFEYQLAEFFKIPEKFGPYLKELEIFACDLIEKELIDILKLAKNNLRKLIIFSTKIDKISHAHENFKLEKLENLQVEHVNCDIFSILLDLVPDTLQIIYLDCQFNQHIGTSFKEVVLKQKLLKDLTIELFQPFSFDILDFDDVRFGMLKLESLQISSDRFLEVPVVPSEKIYRFIKSQQTSLKKLGLMNLNFQIYSDIFESMPNLEALDVGNIASWPSFASGRNYYCPSLKSIVLVVMNDFYNTTDVSNLSSLIKRFANLNEIIFRGNANPALLQLIAQYHPNLKEISFDQFDDDTLENVVFQNVVKLTISGVATESKEFMDSNMDFVCGAFQNLKVLNLLKVQINSRLLAWFLEHFTKLKWLFIDDGSQLKNLCKISHHFKNLTYLYISNHDGVDIKEFRQRLRQFPRLFFRVIPKGPVQECTYN